MILNLTPHQIRLYADDRPDGIDDLLVPYREVRNASGTVIGCRQLAQPV